MNLPRAIETVILKQEDDDHFAIDIDTGEVFHLNETAARILSMCQRLSSLDDAVASLAADLSEPLQDDVIREDIKDAVRQFQELGICQK